MPVAWVMVQVSIAGSRGSWKAPAAFHEVCQHGDRADQDGQAGDAAGGGVGPGQPDLVVAAVGQGGPAPDMAGVTAPGLVEQPGDGRGPSPRRCLPGSGG